MTRLGQESLRDVVLLFGTYPAPIVSCLMAEPEALRMTPEMQ